MDRQSLGFTAEGETLSLCTVVLFPATVRCEVWQFVNGGELHTLWAPVCPLWY